MTGSAETLGKGLRLLAAIVGDEGRSSLAAIARRLAVSLPTAHRLAATLEAQGFVERARKGVYVAGPALADLAPHASIAAATAARLRQQLARLARDERVFAHFGVLEDGMVTYLVREKGATVCGELFTAENMQLEAYCSAIGKVLLAALTPTELDEYLARGPLVALTPHTLADPAALVAELEAVRRDGMAFDRFEVRDDLFCIALPARDAAGRVIGGVSASALGPRPSDRKLGRLRARLADIAGG